MRAVNEKRFPDRSLLRFALFGGGKHLCYLAETLIERKFIKPIIITHPKPQHARDASLLKRDGLFGDVFGMARRYSLKVLETESVNEPFIVNELKRCSVNIGFSLSCRSIIRRNVIGLFKYGIYNIHPSYLPAERGGGTFSWRILNDIREVAATIHVLDEGIDTGDILSRARKKLGLERPYPSDYLRETQRLYEKLLGGFVSAIERGRAIKMVPQHNDESTYLPRLYTELNGAIDWSWNADEIERFIRAFGRPYPGAFTFINGKVIRILKARRDRREIKYHPFMSGKILNIMGSGAVKVAVNGGCLIIEEVMYGDVACKPGKICGITQTFYTPPDILYKARLAVPKVKEMNRVHKVFLRKER